MKRNPSQTTDGERMKTNLKILSTGLLLVGLASERIEANDLQADKFSSELQLAGEFVIFSEGLTLTSTDGVNWLKAAPQTNDSRWALGAGIMVKTGPGALIQTSSNCVSWISRPSGSCSSLFGVAYGNGQFVAVGNEGLLVSSGDGICWTRRNAGTDERLRGIAYGNGHFVVVGYAGTILMSETGRHWTRRQSGTEERLLDVAFGGRLFVAVGWNGLVLTSNDGLTWTARDSGTNTHLRRITYQPGNTILAMTWADALAKNKAKNNSRPIRLNNRKEQS